MLLFAASATAKTIIVEPRGRSISDAVRSANAGDSIIVRRGTYRERVLVYGKSGITITAEAGVVLDGRGTTGNALVVIDESSRIRFENFEVRNSPGAGILVRDSHDVVVRGNNVHHCQTSGIRAASSRKQPIGTTHDIAIENNNVWRCVLQNAGGKAKSWQQAIAVLRADRVRVTGNAVHENFGEGIDAILSDHALIARNEVWDNFSANIYLDNAQSTNVDGNRIRSTGARAFFRGGKPAAGILTANETYSESNPLDGLRIINNVVTRTSSGFQYFESSRGGGLHHTVITGNTFDSTTGPALNIERTRHGAHDTTTFENNTVIRPSGEFMIVPPRGITVRNNKWLRSRAAFTAR